MKSVPSSKVIRNIISFKKISALVVELKKRERKLNSLRQYKIDSKSEDKLRATMQQKIVEWRDLLRGNTTAARQVIQHLIGPIEMWVEEKQDSSELHEMVWKWVAEIGVPEKLFPRLCSKKANSSKERHCQ